MSSAGHILDMIKRQKANLDLKKRYRDSNSPDGNYSSLKVSGKKFNTDKFTPKSESEIENNRVKTISKMSNENKIAWLKTCMIVFIIMILVYWMLTK